MFRKSRCNQTEDLLSAYVDGRLSIGEQQQVEEHTRVCEACTGELESLRTTVALLRLTPTVQPPRSFVLSERTVSRPVRQSAPVLRWSMGLAVALLLILVSGDVLSSVSLGGVSAPSTRMAQKSAEDRSMAPASELAGEAQSNLRAPSAATDEKNRQYQDPSVAAQRAPLSSTGSEENTGRSEGFPPAGRTDASAQPTADALEGKVRPLPNWDLSALRIAEFGLGALTLALVLMNVLRRRARY